VEEHVSRTPALWTTAVALALINVGLAIAIVGAMGSAIFAPMWVGLALTVTGLATAMVAIVLWRRYALSLRER
jgi:hypothetical protein